MFEKLPAFDLESTEHAVRELSEKLGIKAGLIINGVRTAVTGQAAGPGLFELLIAIGRERVVARIRKAAAAVLRLNTVQRGLSVNSYEMLRNVSRTFALSIEQLPGLQREAVTVAYLLFRVADCIEDHDAA